MTYKDEDFLTDESRRAFRHAEAVCKRNTDINAEFLKEIVSLYYGYKDKKVGEIDKTFYHTFLMYAGMIFAMEQDQYREDPDKGGAIYLIAKGYDMYIDQQNDGGDNV